MQKHIPFHVQPVKITCVCHPPAKRLQLTWNTPFTFDPTCVGFHYHPLPPFAVPRLCPWWRPAPRVLDRTPLPSSIPLSLPPSCSPPRSSIMCRLLNGAKRLASDPFQWAMGSSGGAPLSWSGRSDLERPIRIANVPTAFRKHYASGRLVPPDLPPLSHLSLQDIFFSWHPYIQFHPIYIVIFSQKS